jgi:hypothetical protein
VADNSFENMFAPLALLFVAGLAVSVSAQAEMCEKLSQCLADVKAKEISCQQSTPAPATTEASTDSAKADCLEAVKTKNAALKALMQRKGDSYGACINSKASEATAFTNAKKKAKCDALVARRTHAKRQTDDEDEETKPKSSRRGGGGRGGNRKKQPAASDSTDANCSAELRTIRTRCAKLAKCCSITKECRVSDASLDKDIKSARAELRTQSRQCRSGKGGNKGSRRGGKGKGRGGKTTTAAPDDSL